ncbi:MAG TPA: BTAD domain-containing putative transcriptional regulator [Chloroflexia bacterium]|nr:BTAD domain-containing putative transcriptional regulator [Chloroflexia bacterium]
MTTLARDFVETEQLTDKTLRIYVLGRFEVEMGNRALTNEQWRNGKARSLFKILLNRRGYQLSRYEAAELLWPELDLERAYNNLNQAVYSLRRTLEPGLTRASASIYLKTDSTRIQLNPALIGWVDLEEFKRCYQQARLSGDLALYEKAATLYAGDYLPEDLYEDWSVSRREGLRQEWTELLLQMAALYQARHMDDRYQHCLYRVLESDFSHEESAQKLLRALAESGRKEEALNFYRSFVTKLRQRLNLEPLEETRALYQAILANRIPARASSSAPVVAQPVSSVININQKEIFEQPVASSQSRSFTNKPLAFPAVGITELIGRETEQAFWQEKLQEAQVGQGSLTFFAGEAGIGKTALAHNLAQQARQQGFTPLLLSCYPEQADLPFSPISALLGQALNHFDKTQLAELLNFCNPRCLPGLAYLFPTAPALHGEPGLENIYSTALLLFSGVLERLPVALILDDIQFLPGPAIRLLRYLLAQPQLQTLPVVGMLSPVSGAASGELKRLLDFPGALPHSLKKLQRLQPAEVRQLLSRHLNCAPGPLLLETISKISRGNPRLVLALLEGWQQEGNLQPAAGVCDLAQPWNRQIPSTVNTYLRRLVSSLSAEAQVLLQLSGLLGQSFSFEVLRQVVLNRQDGAGWWIELDKTRLGQALTEVTDCGLLEERGTTYWFAYPLLAESLVAFLPHCQRQCWLEVIKWAQETVIQANVLAESN